MKKRTAKRLSVWGLVVLTLLIAATVLHLQHIPILLNPKLSSFGVDGYSSGVSVRQSEQVTIPDGSWLDTDIIADGFAGGTGSDEDPYQIATAEQLGRFAFNINYTTGDTAWHTASYKITADIDLAAHKWYGVGRKDDWGGDRTFRGKLDGSYGSTETDSGQDGGVYTISNMLAINKSEFTNGMMSGFFGVVGNGATVTNLLFDNATATLDPNLKLEDNRSNVSMGIVFAEVDRNSDVFLGAVYVLNSTIFSPYIGAELFEDSIKAGAFVGHQVNDGSGNNKGHINMWQCHAVSTVIAINIGLDKDWWTMDNNTVIHSVGGLIGEARIADILECSYDGVVGIEAVRKDRNLDNWRMIYNLGGLIGLLDAGYATDDTHIYDSVVGASLYLDTFDIQPTRSNTRGEGANIADARYVGAVIGNANAKFEWEETPGGRRGLEIDNVEASVAIEAPNADKEISQQSASFAQRQQERQDEIAKGQEYAKAHKQELDEESRQITKEQTQKFEALRKTTQRQTRSGIVGAMWPFAWTGSIVISGWAAGAADSAATVAFMPGMAGAAVGFSALAIIAIILIVIIIVVILVFAILFSVWAADRPAWESWVYVGGAIGSEGRSTISLTDVHTANTAVLSDTLFSNHDDFANIVGSHNTTPTMAMIIDQPYAPTVENIGEEMTLSISAQGTMMSNDTPGVDSVLTYQWYYNDFDSNEIWGEGDNANGQVTTMVEDEDNLDVGTQPTLDIKVDWVGSRYYFCQVTNNVLQFKGTNPTVTARVGTRNISVKPAEIVQQPMDTTINTSTAGQLSVVAQATGTMTYQWYINSVKSTEDAILLAGATQDTFAPVHNVAGEYYYFVVVTVSVRANNSPDPIRKDTISAIATVTVQANANDFSIASQPTESTVVGQNLLAVIGVEVDLEHVNGTLSYQWFKSSTNDNTSGTALQGETEQSIKVDTSRDGTSYYYVEVTNTVEDTSKTITSAVGQVVVEQAPVVEATINKPLTGGTTNIGVGQELIVFATAGSGANVSYQWFKNDTESNLGGQKITGATKPNYFAVENSAGNYYYYVEVTTTTVQQGVLSILSNPAKVEVLDPNQRSLSITAQPKSVSGVMGEKVVLRVAVEERTGSMNYQWYVSNYADGRNATAVRGAIGNVFRVDSSTVGKKFYFVQVSNATSIVVGHKFDDQGSPISDITRTHINQAPSQVAKVDITNSDKSALKGLAGEAALPIAIIALTVLFLMGAIVLVVNGNKKNRSNQNYGGNFYR